MELNKNTIKKIMGIITFAVLLFVGAQRFDVVLYFVRYLFGLISPFVLGAAIAFILNVPMRGIENKLLSKIKKLKNPKVKRTFSLLLTLLLMTGIIFLVAFLIIPEVGRTIQVIVYEKFPDFIERIQREYSDLLVQYPEILEYLDNYELDWKQIGEGIVNFMRNSGTSMLQSTFGIASSILGGVINFFLGFIFAIYILIQKERLGRQIKKLFYAYLPKKVTDKFLSICSLSSKTFSSFLSGQCVEAVILGLMFFFTLSILRFPYALLIGVAIGFLALIPIFGAFVGCFIGAFLIIIVDPIKAFWFLIIFLIIQQIEGNLIYPRVVGSSVGLPSMWVLVAVTIGGNIMGVAGMLIFIPMTSVIYTLTREAVNHRLKKKKIVV